MAVSTTPQTPIAIMYAVPRKLRILSTSGFVKMAPCKADGSKWGVNLRFGTEAAAAAAAAAATATGLLLACC